MDSTKKSSLTSPVLELRDLVVRREGRIVLNLDLLSIYQGEMLVVIGPNGAGKSTLLMIAAQLLPQDEGQLYFKGRRQDKSHRLAYRRRIGLVLQNSLLLNTSVFENVAIGLRFRKVPKTEIESRVDNWLERLNISHLRERQAGQLSGGEAQRVSLARALAVQPELLLLDEPFSALDAPTRSHLINDFQSLLQETNTTAFLVTHDMNEALILGDKVAVLLNGNLRQVGTPEQVFNAPADSDIAAFVGVETAVKGEVKAAENERIIVVAGGQNLEAVGDLPAGQKVLFCLRPEDVTLWIGEDLPASSARNRLTGTVVKLNPQGSLILVTVDCGFPLSALITRTSANEMALKAGSKVTATFKASAAHLIPR